MKLMWMQFRHTSTQPNSWAGIAQESWIGDAGLGATAFDGKITVPGWKSKPSWYLVATEDKMIPPPAQRQMSKRAGSTVVEVPGSHAIYVSKPKAVADLIEQAASNVSAATK